MRSILDILAKTISIILYPIWMPTIGVSLLCIGLSAHMNMPTNLWLVTIIGTALITIIIPLTAILIRIKRGKTKDLYIENKDERTLPYLYTLICYLFWCYLLIAILKVPLFVGLSSTGATLALLCVVIINRWWKISAHLSGMGGLIGGVTSYYLFMQSGGIGWLISLLLLALLLMYARIYLKAHTPLQTVCGFLLGILWTFIPNLVFFYHYAQ